MKHNISSIRKRYRKAKRSIKRSSRRKSVRRSKRSSRRKSVKKSSSSGRKKSVNDVGHFTIVFKLINPVNNRYLMPSEQIRNIVLQWYRNHASKINTQQTFKAGLHLNEIDVSVYPVSKYVEMFQEDAHIGFQLIADFDDDGNYPINIDGIEYLVVGEVKK